ncbi:hypothetical protein ACWCQN_22760 [Streptomyces sp. NPDC001984]|uniref:hypothetical protein n=1 Tax=Streptomyces sp. NPDC002619 TaxID=3364655 RepID=UPI0036B20ECF
MRNALRTALVGSSVPAALKLKKRIKRFALDKELDHLPIGDIVSVALDEWLTARGFRPRPRRKAAALPQRARGCLAPTIPIAQ